MIEISFYLVIYSIIKFYPLFSSAFRFNFIYLFFFLMILFTFINTELAYVVRSITGRSYSMMMSDDMFESLYADPHVMNQIF